MTRFLKPSGFALAVFALMMSSAFAQADGSTLFVTTMEGDWARGWLQLLFREDAVVATGLDALSSLAQAMREGLHVYGLSMFAVAGLVLMWQLASMIAETAQTGVVMGRRANQLWAPLRFLIGIALLIPLGGGLSFGQHVIVKVAGHGSSLASDAWRGALTYVGDKFLAPVVPVSPDVSRVVVTSLESELCRSMYRHFYAAYRNDTVVSLAGDMGSFIKIPAQSLSEETWRYTTSFFPDASLCGEYRFGAERVAQDTFASFEDQAASAFRDTSLVIAQRLSVQNSALADRLSLSFLSTDPQKPAPPDIRKELSVAVAEQTELVDAKIKQILTTQQKSETSVLYGDRGWIVAGAFPFDMARRQIAVGEAASLAWPKVKPPLLGHSVLTFEDWMRNARQHPALRIPTEGQYDRYAVVYDRVSAAMKSARGWLYDRQIEMPAAVLPDQQDIRDVVNNYADSDVARSAFAHMMTRGAVAFGVFARAPEDNEAAAYRNMTSSSLLGQTYLIQPIQTVAEIGRRFMSYGSWLLGMLSPALSQPATVGLAGGLTLVAALFWLAGASLIFLVPLIPFYRFVIAALSWALSVLAAVVFLPIVALGHLYPAGDGLVGPLARRAYWMWLGIFMRPCLILLAFAGGLILFLLGVGFVNAIVLEWLAPVATAHSSVFWVFRAALALIYAAAVFAISNVAFRGISSWPDMVMDWIGAHSVMPESVVMASGVGGVNSMITAVSPSSGNVAIASASVSSSSRSHADHAVRRRDGGKPDTAPTAQGHSAHFPLLPDDHADRKAEAYAAARASATIKSEMAGKMEASVAAGAASSSSATEQKAAAVTGVTTPADKGSMTKTATRLLAPDDYKKAAPETIEGKVTPSETPSAEKKPEETPAGQQAPAALEDENNPFKSKPVGEEGKKE